MDNPKYEVSSFGNLRHKLNRKVRRKFYICPSNGYYSTNIRVSYNRDQTVFIHQIVAKTFLPLPNTTEKLVVNHKDSNKLNNRVDNLEWCTYRENYRHAVKNNLLVVARGSRAGLAKLTEEKVYEMRVLMKYGFQNKELMKLFNVSSCVVSLIRQQKIWKHVKGVQFEQV